MRDPDRRRSPDSAPWDGANGLRVGLVVGGTLGAVLALITGLTHVATLLAAAAGGGLVGWLSQRRGWWR